MPGGYEPTRDIHVSVRASVHEAVAAAAGASGGGPRALKIFRTGLPRGPRRLALLQAQLAAIEAQTAACARRPDRWAPVHAGGRCPDGVYAVTDLYQRSFQRIIDGRLTVDPPTLHAVARGVIEGLVALEQAAARPHGALKPANIFVPGAAILRKSSILLAEPAPLAGITHEQARAGDFRALGTLLVTLVRKRARAGWPIEDSPEWRVLGKHARAWIDFCNYLIDPHAKPADFTLDELQRRFARLGGRALPVPVKAALVAAPLVVLASPFAWLRFAPFEKLPESVQEFAIKLGNLPPDVEEVPPEFGELCTAWFEWFGSLCAELDDPRVRARWNADPWLRERVTAIADTRARLDPRLITDAGPNLESLEALRAAPPASAKRGLVVRHIKQARATLATLAGSLEKWPGGKRLADASARLQSRGWDTAALELQPPPPPTLDSGRLALDIDTRLVLLENAAAAEHAWTAVTRAATVLADTGDPVLPGLSDMVRLRVGRAPLAELSTRLAGQQPLLDTRVAFVRGDWAARVDHARWLREGFVRDFTGPVTDEVLARWDADIRPYYLVGSADDPRVAVDWDAAAARLASVLRSLTGEEAQLGLGAAVSTPFTAEAATLSSDLAALRSRKVLRKDISTVTDEVAALQARFNDLAARLAVALDDMRPVPAEWLTRVRADSIAGSPVLQAEWARRRDQLLDGVTEQTLAADEADFRALRARLRRVREFLGALDGPQAAGGIEPVNLAGIPEAIAAQTSAADSAQKEAVLAEFLTQVQWAADGAPAASIADFVRLPAVRARLAALAGTRSAAAALAAGLARLETLLGLGAAWSEPVALGSEAATSIQKIMTDAAASPAFAAVTAAGHPADLVASARRLESLQSETDRAALADTAASGQPLSLPLAAWNRLDALPDWPASLEELDREIALESALKSRIEKSDTFSAAGLIESQKAKIGAIATQAPHRWRRAYAQIDPAFTPEVLQRMPQMGVAPDDLAGLDRFDYLLANAKTTRWARLSEADAQTRRDEFVSLARAIPEAAADSAVARFLGEAAAVNLEPTGEATTPADIGPGRIGWQGEFTDDGRRATYRWTDLTGTARIQEYLLVEPEAGVPFFLSTRAISIGDFIALVEQYPAGAEVTAAMPAYLAAVSEGTDTDARPGPQTWRILAPRRATARRLNDSRMTLNNRWTAYLDPRWPEPLYAPGLDVPAAPTAAHPLQNIPPAAARVFTERILGARLATPEEWASLATLYADRASPSFPGVNFSDAAWLAQRDYLIQRGANFEYPWPDSGAFVPVDYAGGARQAALPYAPGSDDRTLWFAETGGTGGDFAHLYGNVATYLHDPLTDRYFVAGGSALSPAGLDPKTAYPIDAFAEGYADVGLRPAFDASKAMIIRASLIKLLRLQPYVRQPQK
ncbi:hypothetical protein OH491_02040 [Termitidicoccus mucosus]|uniref:Protein kinase domain-containing protein n=1 Tax=Termitidicoccus mucosus TaxID=1184151 RepID=A0A178IN42_9BACT|nr:hypothetical protein AW736_07520 [Opitutaceae bacterium TSB47]